MDFAELAKRIYEMDSVWISIRNDSGKTSMNRIPMVIGKVEEYPTGIEVLFEENETEFRIDKDEVKEIKYIPNGIEVVFQGFTVAVENID